MKLFWRFLIVACCMKSTSFAQLAFNDYPTYKGNDLGVTYQKQAAVFRIWSPVATGIKINIYRQGDGGEKLLELNLEKAIAGTWLGSAKGDFKNHYYTIQVKFDSGWSKEISDPYSIAVGVNGKRSMIIDPKDANPLKWALDKSPAFSATNAATDAVIYELHIRDLSSHSSSGIIHKGKYLGLAETNTQYQNYATGLQHIKELGVTHVHLLPFFDYNSVDESKPEKNHYNWGYDPGHYNAPEGSYSTDPTDGLVRMRELKTMIAAMHKNQLRVVMDVVYNHTALSATSNFNILVPGYYYRQNEKGGFSDATACGNELASERSMVRHFMLQSLSYWVKHYHIDGFRFDLMGVHDIATMNLISKELHALKPDILLYGEGWTASGSPLPDSLRALKKNASKLNRIAVFGDDFRDGIKGSVFEEKDRGFVSGKPDMEMSVKFGIVAACKHPQIDYNGINYSKSAYAKEPWQSVTYCECHDNHTLADKLKISAKEATTVEVESMHRLALTLVLTSQGIPFLHAGTEFMRSKNGVENSYQSGDSINAIDWREKVKHIELVNYVRQLIKIRKEHPAFRLNSAAAIRKAIRFDEAALPGTIVYTINGASIGDSWKKAWLAFNGTADEKVVKLPLGKWVNALNNEVLPAVEKSEIKLRAYGAVILFQR
ncbi:MAG: type pullulanase [Bacteroidota bacterium]